MTRGFARGAAIGALVLTGFGGFWAFESVVNQPEARTWEYVAAGVTGALLAGLCVLRLVGASNLAEADDPALAARAGRRMGMSFGIIFGIEGLLIGAAAGALARAGRPLLIPVAIALIVGLHFFPLARVFQVRVYDLTGLLCVVAGLGSLLVPDGPARLVALGFAMTAVLWISATVVLVRYTGLASGSDRS